MGGLQKQTLVLHVRGSQQIDETCYIPQIYVSYARQSAQSRRVWSRTHGDPREGHGGAAKMKIGATHQEERINE